MRRGGNPETLGGIAAYRQWPRTSPPARTLFGDYFRGGRSDGRRLWKNITRGTGTSQRDIGESDFLGHGLYSTSSCCRDDQRHIGVIECDLKSHDKSVAPIPFENEKRHWRVKDNIYSPWRDLAGTHTGAEIWELLNRRRFSDAMPADETLPEEAASDD